MKCGAVEGTVPREGGRVAQDPERKRGREGLESGPGTLVRGGGRPGLRPRSGSGEGRRPARPPARTWGPARHLPLGRP